MRMGGDGSACGKGDFGIQFIRGPEARKALIQDVYAGPYDADIKDVRPNRVAKALLSRMFS